MIVYVFIEPCGCVTGAAWAASPESADMIAEAIRDGRRVEPHTGPIAIPQLCAVHSCQHERLNEDGICRQCGADRRGI
jgi:hypothetical protein